MKKFFIFMFFFVQLIKAESDGTFDFLEKHVEKSPTELKSLALEKGESIVDFDVSPISPLVAIIVKMPNGKQKILFWKIGIESEEKGLKNFDVPTD